MKRLFVFAYVMTITMVASAQITWNVKAGAGMATLWGSDVDKSKPHFVAKAGIGIEKPLNANWSFMPSFEIAWKGYKSDIYRIINDYIYKPVGESTNDFLYLQIPILAAYRLNLSNDWNMTLKAGPYFGYAVYNHYSYSYSDEGRSYSGSRKSNNKKFDAGIDAGFDFEHHRFVLGVEAEMGFLNLYDANVKNLAFYATIGYKF